MPLRRWEDWERSRLRKLRREERRKRELERMHGNYIAANGELTAGGDMHSQYDGSDTVSVVSSDDDHWGAQIGGYNENSASYPPPPLALVPNAFDSAESVAGAELEAMLEVGFDDRPSHSQSRAPLDAPRYQLSDRAPTQNSNGYTPLARSTSPGLHPPRDHAPSPISPTRPTNAISTAVGGDWQTHAKKRSGGRSAAHEYGPLGPLDPSSRI